jgi:hypothetical protein
MDPHEQPVTEFPLDEDWGLGIEVRRIRQSPIPIRGEPEAANSHGLTRSLRFRLRFICEP